MSFVSMLLYVCQALEQKGSKMKLFAWQARRNAWRWTRCSRWRAAASTTTWAAAFTVTPSTSSGTCRTLRRCGVRICCHMHMQAPAHPGASVWGSAHRSHQLTRPGTGDARTPLLTAALCSSHKPLVLHAHAAAWSSTSVRLDQLRACYRRYRLGEKSTCICIPLSITLSMLARPVVP